VHRIGRVGRAGRGGVAITLAEPREHRLLKNIERVTGQRITIEKVPTVADLHARRLEMTLATVRESILEGDLEAFRVVVETLTDEFDVMEVALAAVRLAHEGDGTPADEEEIPEVAPMGTRDRRPGAGRDERRGGRGAGAGEATSRIFIGLGRSAGIRPQDLVGAIANESNISGRQIGEIEIADRFSLVEVPASAAGQVIAALRATTIKGRKATVRRDRQSR
jgi:ATP-dependent RNA helicase DeaD